MFDHVKAPKKIAGFGKFEHTCARAVRMETYHVKRRELTSRWNVCLHFLFGQRLRNNGRWNFCPFTLPHPVLRKFRCAVYGMSICPQIHAKTNTPTSEGPPKKRLNKLHPQSAQLAAFVENDIYKNSICQIFWQWKHASVASATSLKKPAVSSK